MYPDQEPDKLIIFLSHTAGEMPIKLSSLAFFWLLVHVAEPALLKGTHPPLIASSRIG